MNAAIGRLKKKILSWGDATDAFRGCCKQMGGIEPDLLALIFALAIRFGQEVGEELVFRAEDCEVVVRPLAEEAFDMIVRRKDSATEYLDIDLPNGSLAHWDKGLDSNEALVWAINNPPTRETLPCDCDSCGRDEH